MNTSFEFQGSTQTSKKKQQQTKHCSFPPFSFFFYVCLCFSDSFSHSLFPPKASFEEYTHHFITLMNLVGFSRRGRPPVMLRQMPPVPRQPLLMFKVMQRDRLIKRRLRDALGPSLSHHDRLVTSGSRVLQPRDGGRRMEMVPQEPSLALHTHTYTQTSFLSFVPLALTVPPQFNWIYGGTGVHGETSRPCFN